MPTPLQSPFVDESEEPTGDEGVGAAVDEKPTDTDVEQASSPDDEPVPIAAADLDSMLGRVFTLPRNLIDRAPVTTSSATPVPRVHLMFVMLGLKSVFITEAGRLVGVVWRTDMVEGNTQM